MYRYYSVKEICNELNINRNTFYSKTKGAISIIKLKTKNVRQCLFTDTEKKLLIDMLKNSVKKLNKPI